MNWPMKNWVERRAAREQNLRNAGGVWKRAQAAVMEACDSLGEHYATIAKIERTKQDGRVVIRIIPASLSGQRPQTELTTKVVSIEFDPGRPAIVVTIDDMLFQEFPIQADSDHAFITLNSSELLLDEFSRLALEKTFFTTAEVATYCHRLRLIP